MYDCFIYIYYFLINNEEKSYIPNIAERVEIIFNKKVDENNLVNLNKKL